MSDTKLTLEALDAKLDKRFDDVVELMQTFMFQVDDRFNKLEARIDEFDKKLDRLTVTLDKFAARLDTFEIETAASDHRFEKLLNWAKDVSKKTGIPLKDL